MYDKVKFLTASDTCICVEFGNEVSEEINNKIRAFSILINQKEWPEIVELVPTYRSMAVFYRPELARAPELEAKLQELLEELARIELPPAEVVDIPVLYGGEEYGPDLAFVAESNGLTQQEVIDIHSSEPYLIYMLGFTPGFPYLGGMDERIATPRIVPPRLKIIGGSVGIAGSLTGIYPIDSPGGWQIIGRTPIKLYDPEREKPIYLEAGQKIKFRPIDQAEFQQIADKYQAQGGES